MLKELEAQQVKEFEEFKFYVNVWFEKLGLAIGKFYILKEWNTRTITLMLVLLLF